MSSVMQMALLTTATAAAPTTTTFDPANKSSNITLSGGDLTATNGSTGEGRNVRSIASHATGKYYCEFTLVEDGGDAGFDAPGVVNATFPIGDNSTYLGETSDGVGAYGDGSVYRNNSVVATIAAFTQGAVVCMAVDADNERIWWRTNGGNWNNSATADPATNTEGVNLAALGGGTLYAAVEPGAATGAFTANFGGTAYAHTPPSGFGNW